MIQKINSNQSTQNEITAPLKINVTLWGTLIGVLSWDKVQRISTFQFTKDYMAKPYNLIPTRPQKQISSFLGTRGDYDGLPPFIADSLPDKWGSIVFDKWLSDSGLSSSDNNPLLKLAYIGKRGMGALEFTPVIDDHNKGTITLETLESLARKIYNDRQDVKLSQEEQKDFKNFAKLGTPAGGAHSKALISLDENGNILSGQVKHSGNCKEFIIKFKEDFDVPATEIEMCYHDMARIAGIRMTNCQLIKINGHNHFLTERYDRKDGEKIMALSMAALIPNGKDYTNLFFLCDTLHLKQTEKTELFRRMCFNVVAGITDDHNRNFSFLMFQDGHWELSPDYDVMFTANIWEKKDSDIHCIGINTKHCFFKAADLIDFGKDFDIPNPEKELQKICIAVSNFGTIARKYNVPEKWIHNISNALDEIFPERHTLSKKNTIGKPKGIHM